MAFAITSPKKKIFCTDLIDGLCYIITNDELESKIKEKI